MPKIKTSELTGAALDWAVAEAQGISRVTEAGFHIEYANPNVTGAKPVLLPFPRCYSPSTRWAQGGPIVEREGIGFFCNRTAAVGARFTPDAGADWRAFAFNKHAEHHFGPTPLIAAMRCFIASKLGDEVEIPEELTP